jgi:predicted 3-demethylubiquinone-9 3-methyltransferase (glyoxalase superfamily)
MVNLPELIMQKINVCLWFNDQAEQAMEFYLSVFKNSKRGKIVRYGAAGPGPEGQVMTVTFELEGMQFMGLNGGPQFKFTEAISLVVNCETQAEIDEYWQKLTADGGAESMCGWLKDKFGLSWQIVPPVLVQMLEDKDPARSQRVMAAMMKMHKLDIAKLKAAYNAT